MLATDGAAPRADSHPAPDLDSLEPALVLRIHRLMARSRALDELLIRMAHSGEGAFWIGGPGEEAFQIPLGLQVRRGQGPAFDYLILHYRNLPTLVALGLDPADALRQMAMRATDPFSRGRNFVAHFCRRDWNLLPIASAVGLRHTIAPGTALVQKRHGGEGITIVTGGDASTSLGDFASCLVWSTRPGQELPVLVVVQNNGVGISTPYSEVHAEGSIVERGRAFGIPGEVVDGNDPVASWHAVRRAMAWCRRQRRPYLLDARVARLHGHSSTSGAARDPRQPDCLALWEDRLARAGLLDPEAAAALRAAARAEAEAALVLVRGEPEPRPGDVSALTYAPSPVDALYPDDYTGLPHADLASGPPR